MDRYAIFVDAGYVFAEGGKLCCGTRNRTQIDLDVPKLRDATKAVARARLALGSSSAGCASAPPSLLPTRQPVRTHGCDPGDDLAAMGSTSCEQSSPMWCPRSSRRWPPKCTRASIADSTARRACPQALPNRITCRHREPVAARDIAVAVLPA